jgi:putative phage-type endonuclease
MSLTLKQLEERKAGVGGSEGAIVLGLSRFKTARELYHEKRGEIPVSYVENDVQRWGRLLEGAVTQEYSERTKRVVRRPEGTLWHPQHTFMCGHPDGITECRRLFEAKTVVPQLADLWGDAGTDLVPQDYLIQCQHYMVLLDLPIADLAALMGRFDFRIYTIPADRELQEMLIEAEADFVRRVREGDPPAIDFEHRNAIEVVRKLHPGTNGARLIASSQAEHWRRRLDRISRIKKRIGAAETEAKAHLLEEMGEAALLAFPDGQAYRRQKVERAAYSVEASSYIDARFVKDRKFQPASNKG